MDRGIMKSLGSGVWGEVWLGGDWHENQLAVESGPFQGKGENICKERQEEFDVFEKQKEGQGVGTW